MANRLCFDKYKLWSDISSLCVFTGFFVNLLNVLYPMLILFCVVDFDVCSDLLAVRSKLFEDNIAKVQMKTSPILSALIPNLSVVSIVIYVLNLQPYV